MTWLGKLNPTPEFPAYTGPHKVGSVDVEIPTSQLQSPAPSDSPSTNLQTVAFRIFYPARQESSQKGERWIPPPQREYVGAYARFLGAGSAFSQVFSALPQLLYYISMPVHRNADLLEPTTKSKRWPVVMFSHGLGGSRNAYSHICGSLASHGIVVVAPDHRDGSSPISFINTPEDKEKSKRVEYKKVAHSASTEVYQARDEQLRTRLLELGFVHDALLKIDNRTQLTNVAEDQQHKDSKEVLPMFAGTLNVHEPGAISWAGHSFGAATMVQFVKSVYYRPDLAPADFKPLFVPSPDSSIVRQVTPASPVMLLDLWTLPIQSPSTSWLRSKPMPCYESPNGGSNLLAILSEAFYKWTANLDGTKRTLQKPAASDSKHPNQPGAHIFYPISSAHLSQSDFGVLFPWVTTKIFGAKEPERVLKLNARAMLQVMRNAGKEVANTSALDMELENVKGMDGGVVNDEKILESTKGSVRDWVSLSTESASGTAATVEKSPEDAVYEGEGLGQVVSREERDSQRSNM
jgi:platelet-activating factor acetylhydrolase